MFYIYWLLLAFLVVIIVWNLFDEADIKLRASYALLVVPFLLRLFVLK